MKLWIVALLLALSALSTLQAQASRPPSKSRRQQETDDLFEAAMARARAADAADQLTIEGRIQ